MSKEPKPGRQQVYQSNIASKYWTLEGGSCRDTGRDLNYPCKKEIPTQEKEAALGTLVDMQDNDIFQAEYVFVMDSDDEEDKSMPRSINEKSDSISNQCQRVPSAISLTTMESRSTTAPVGTVNVSVPQFSISSQEKLTTLSSTTHLISSTLPAINVASPSNQRVNNVVQTPNQTFSSEDDSKPFLPINNSRTRLIAPDYSSPSSAMQHMSAHNSSMPSSPSESQKAKPCHKKMSNTLSQSLSPERPYRTGALSPLPTHIETHHLCPHPKPLQSPMYGSSSTICSTEELCSPMSAHRTLSKSGKSTSLPSRLSFLTAILKSGQTTKQRSGTPTPYLSSPSSKPRSSAAHTVCQKSTKTKTLSTNWATLKQGDLKPRCSEYSHKQPSTLPSPLEFSVWNQPLQAPSQSPSQQHKTLDPYLVSPKPFIREKAVSPVVQQRFPSPTMSSSTSKAQSLSPLNLKPPIRKELKRPFIKCTEPGKFRRDRTPSPTVSSYTSQSIPLSSNQKVTTSPDAEKHLSENNFSPKYASSKVVSTPLPTLRLSVASSTHAPTSSELPSPRSQSTPPLPVTPVVHFYPPQRKCLSPSHPLRHYSRSPDCEPMPAAVSTPRMSPVPSLSSPRSTLSRSCEWSSAQSLSSPQSPDNENKAPKHYNITSRYKTFAAIPTNTLLREQKAIDEPAQSSHDAEDILDTYSEMCSPAQLRQQTEEVCAAIDDVLQDPLPVHCDRALPSPNVLIHSDEKKMSSSLPRTAGRETKYAALSPPNTIPTYVQQTRPGAIRPLLVKPTILLKREETYYINPYQ